MGMHVTYKLLTLQWEFGFDLDYLPRVFLEGVYVWDVLRRVYGRSFRTDRGMSRVWYTSSMPIDLQDLYR